MHGDDTVGYFCATLLICIVYYCIEIVFSRSKKGGNVNPGHIYVRLPSCFFKSAPKTLEMHMSSEMRASGRPDGPKAKYQHFPPYLALSHWRVQYLPSVYYVEVF